MEETYLQKILKHFYTLDMGSLSEKTRRQAGRAFMDYCGIAVYAAKNRCCENLVRFFMDCGAAGSSAPFGEQAAIHGSAAGAANAGRISSLEMDDVSGVNASVHAGVYVWSAAVEAYKAHPCDMDEFIRAALLGYDICIRFGMLATPNVRKYGLHGPGMIGGLASAATASVINGFTMEQTENAIALVGTLLPMCPFISFIEGTDSKDMYGAWGVYQGLLAVEAVKHGLTGPKMLLEGTKGLHLFFDFERGKDIPFGEPYYMDATSFKEFSGCFSVHPAMACLLDMQEALHLKPEDVVSVYAETYPYSYALSKGSDKGPLSPSSARLSLPYCISYTLYEGFLHPDAFKKENMAPGSKYVDFMKKVEVGNHEEYGESEEGIRGCILKIETRDGQTHTHEVLHSRWNGEVTDEMLTGKFDMLTKGHFTKEEREEILSCFLTPLCPENLNRILDMLKHVNG